MKTVNQGNTGLFISYVKPHKPVSAQRIAKWIKATIGEAGIILFSAHSIRGVASTAAVKQGIMMEEVLKMADLTSESTFKKFYYRPTVNPVFAPRRWTGL